MQPNVSVAEAIGHRARFAWLGVLLAATVALLVASSVTRSAPPPREVVQQRVQRAEWTQHRCYKARKHAEAREAERAQRAVERAQRAAERAEQRARRAAERAERRARGERIPARTLFD
jgi:hypothetical protein